MTRGTIPAKAGRPTTPSIGSRSFTPTPWPAHRRRVRNLLRRPAAESDLTELYHYIAERSGSLGQAAQSGAITRSGVAKRSTPPAALPGTRCGAGRHGVAAPLR